MRKKSFLQSFAWVGIMLLLMGCFFLMFAIIIQIIPMNPGDVTVRYNGEPMPSTEASVSFFKLIFLFGFGTPALILMSIGGILFGRTLGRKKRNRKLIEDGACVNADVIEYAHSAIRVNGRAMNYLRCAYTMEGKTYVFKSGLLRMNPAPYLSQNKVKVYYDRANMKRYFVDIDGSLNTEICEL